MSDRFLPGCDGPRPKCETCADRGLIYDDGALVPCLCRKPCATCKDTGLVWVACCGPGASDCCCAYDDGKTPEPCPEAACVADPFAN